MALNALVTVGIHKRSSEMHAQAADGPLIQ
jgi:hypothetical protein